MSINDDAQKKNYYPPELTEYGNLQVVTKSLGNYGSDGVIGSRENQ